MKYLILLLGIIWGGYSFGAEDHFVLRGSIHGLKDGAVVELFTGRSTFLSAKLENRQFEFRGKMDRPTHCRLRIHEGRRYWKADFFVENGEAKVAFHSPVNIADGLTIYNLPTTTQQPNLYIDAAGNLYRCAQ